MSETMGDRVKMLMETNRITAKEYAAATIAFELSGDSMYPKLQERDQVLCAPLAEWWNAKYDPNAVYVVLYDDVLAIKYVRAVEGGLTLLSENTKYPKVNINFQQIRAVWRVLAKINKVTRY